MQEDLAYSRVAELEAKLDVLQVRFDKLRAVVNDVKECLDIWTDDEDISEARETLKAALSI